MRRLPLLLPLLLACGGGDPPPGEAIGTFAFVATLAPDAGACGFAGLPERIEFDGGLSHDRETGTAWLQIDESLREGTIDAARFAVSLQPDADGTPRRIPRRLRACDCDLLFEEAIEGRLVESVAAGCPATFPDDPLGPDTCPRIDEEGLLSWDTCGGVCGTLIESVTSVPGASCTCTIEGEARRGPVDCEIVYRLEARRIGGL